jgi:hypothetical protein
MPLDSVSRVFVMSDLLTPMAIRVAATLRLADGTAPAGVDPDALDRLLRFLTEIGVFTRDDDGAYAATELGEVLRSDHPSGLRDRLDLDGALGRAELAFAQLLHTVRTGEPGFPAQFGMSFWDDVVGDDTRLTSFNAQMASDVKAWARAIIGAYDWGSLGHVVDVGGGDGTLILELAHAFRSLRGSVFELAPTAATARVDAIAGSFFDPWPRADAYLLTAIIHDWSDEPARAILRRGAETGRPVFVIEKIGTDGVTVNPRMDLLLLAHMGGRERSREELIALAESAGCTLAAVHGAGAIVILELH